MKTNHCCLITSGFNKYTLSFWYFRLYLTTPFLINHKAFQLWLQKNPKSINNTPSYILSGMPLQINNWFLCQLGIHRDMKHAVAWKARKRKSCSRRIKFSCANAVDISIVHAHDVRAKLQRWNWLVRQPCIHRDMKHLGSLKRTQEAKVALVYLIIH